MSVFSNLVIDTINFLYDMTGNYGVSIILFTIFIRLIIMPLSIKSLQFSRLSAKLTPETNALKEKYKNDPDKLNQATMELWKQHNFNPLAGCLPTLLQMPLILAILSVMRDPDLYKVSEPMFLGLNMMLPKDGAYAWTHGPQYLILPILSVITTYMTTQFITKANQQAEQQSMAGMNIVMTLMIGWYSLRFSTGLVLYWVVGNLVQALTHIAFNAYMERVEMRGVTETGGKNFEKERNKKR